MVPVIPSHASIKTFFVIYRNFSKVTCLLYFFHHFLFTTFKETHPLSVGQYMYTQNAYTYIEVSDDLFKELLYISLLCPINKIKFRRYSLLSASSVVLCTSEQTVHLFDLIKKTSHTHTHTP